MNFMIHACPQRMWYVDEYLIPSMRAQGIENITVWNDTEQNGNLYSCMESFKACGLQDGGTWHIQDDVIISRDFAKRTAELDDGIVCGFGCQNFGPSMQQQGVVPACFMWYSFQCIRIPNDLAAEFVEWFYNDALFRNRYASHIVDRKHDDWFFREFILEKHRDKYVNNLVPSLVDHIDYLIGGTIVNKQRNIQMNRAKWFPDQDLVEELAQKMT